MAQKRITELQLIDDVTAGISIPVDDGIQSYRATAAQFKDYITPVLIPMTRQIFTSGSGTYNKNYTFLISGGSATAGATYTNNSVTFTVYKTVASASLVVMSGDDEPSESGTLTKTSGTGDSTISFSAFKAPLHLRLRMVGAGGGGGGNGNTGTGQTAGGDGDDTVFGAFTAYGGGGGDIGTGSSNGAGGAGSSYAGSPDIGMQGASGHDAQAVSGGSVGGANSVFGGAGGAVGSAANGKDGMPNTGGGAGGAPNLTTIGAGGGGGAGAYVEHFYSPPASATYSYTVGDGGAAGQAGTSGYDGGLGGSGIIIVEEYFQ